MGSCTSTIKERQRQRRRRKSSNLLVLEKKSSGLPLFSTSSLKTDVHRSFAIPMPSNSLIQFYSVSHLPAPSKTFTGFIRPVSMINRPPVQPRIGCIPRPVVPGLQHARATSLAVRSRSISPSSTVSSNSSSSASSQRRPKVNRPTPVSSTVKAKVPPIYPKTDLNTIRDRYRTHQRINFFNRPSTVIQEEKSISSATEPPASSSREDSAYASLVSPPPRSSSNRPRPISLLSSSSGLSNVLNQDALLDDGNCSLKSVDLLCDHDETLTLDSTSKIGATDSSSTNSLSTESNQKTMSAASIRGNLRESLDELTELSYRVDQNDAHRKSLTRSVSLKPPSSTLPPLDDAEQLTMDIESYRQIMKDVMVVKTILHQLDRLLKQTDSNSMTDSMIGSFHESTRRFSSTAIDGHQRHSIDENATYDDLVKEVLLLRKEREQDKQIIKLLQEQMYKYSSH